MSKDNSDKLYTIKKSSLKRELGNGFAWIIRLYIKINHVTTIIFKKIFSGHKTMQKLLSSDAIVLFFNTILLAFIGNVFGGLIGQVTMIIAFLNILAFLVQIMGWVDKLEK